MKEQIIEKNGLRFKIIEYSGKREKIQLCRVCSNRAKHDGLCYPHYVATKFAEGLPGGHA